MDDKQLRSLLLELLDGSWVHSSLDAILHGVPKECQGKGVRNIPYTLWELLEHIRLSQKDILEYVRNPDYEPKRWPDGYWPRTKAPKKESDWQRSVREIKRDRRELSKIILSKKDLMDLVPKGEKGHTILREVLIAAQHNSYHLGQMVAIRRLLKIW